MLHLFDQHAALFQSWAVTRYEREGDAYLLQIRAVLQDGSLLEIRDYLFADHSRKYAYQWMEENGALRRRWDDAPHWPDVDTHPHHVHLPDEEQPATSMVTNLEDLLRFLQDWFASEPDTPQ